MPIEPAMSWKDGLLISAMRTCSRDVAMAALKVGLVVVRQRHHQIGVLDVRLMEDVLIECGAMQNDASDS